MGSIKGRFADQDSYVASQQGLLTVNNNVEFNVSIVENDFTRATSASFANQAPVRNLINPLPDVTLAGQNSIGAALGGIDQPPAAFVPSPVNPCFAGETIITLNSDVKPIIEIQTGIDWVKCHDRTGTRVNALVIGKHEHWVTESLIVKFADGRVTHTNAVHPYWVQDDLYLPIATLDWVWHWKDRWIQVDVKEKIVVKEPMMLYNLEIDVYQNYEANGDSVHNLKPAPSDV